MRELIDLHLLHDVAATPWVFCRRSGELGTLRNGTGSRGEGGPALRTAPLFETGDERCGQLNRVQAVSIGRPGQGSVTDTIYALDRPRRPPRAPVK